jgi:F-type H+-transporting ATPase subunit b
LKLKLKPFAASLFLPLALMFVLAAAPAHAVQPQSETAAQPQLSQGSKETEIDPKTHKPIKYQKEESEDIFRHTRLVESIGKALHLDVETTARIFEWANFAIIFFAIVIPLARILPKALRNRRETLSRSLEEARKTTADANSRLSAVEAQLSKLDEEIAKIRAQVEDEIRNDEARIKSSLGEESARIVAAAEQEIAVAAAQAQRGLKAFAADLAIDQAVKQLTLTAENDRALIEEFVSEAGQGGAR